MRKLLFALTALFLMAAWANHCPVLMKEIDAKLATNPTMSKDVSDKVIKLRADGEAFHKAGKHDDSVKSLDEAKKLLGI